MRSTDYVRRDGARIVSPEGLPVFSRGMGLGGWLLPEGYMWKLTGPVDSPRRIEELVSTLLGPEAADQFWREYRARFITREDLQLIAQAGFDHVRLPVNSRVVFDGKDLIDDGIAHVDDTIAWCRDAGLTCVIDLHGAPGGQTGENIDDSPRRRPELFTDPTYYAQGLRLWRLLADRYVHEPVVSMYDLLNEPLPDKHESLVPELLQFYRDVIAEIRDVDPHHLLSIEGWHWSTRFDGLDRVLDENSCLHFHKYWSEPSVDSIRQFLDLREQLGLPLWMGESGENDEDWYREAFTMFESQQIPWTFWTWKKIDGPTSPLVVRPPVRWDEVTAFAAGNGPAPQDSEGIFEELLEGLDVGRCSVRSAVLDSLPGITSSELQVDPRDAEGRSPGTERERGGSEA
ncbi:MAG: endoglucanase [Brachybacterium faecium]|nr:MAG: endoglucanase [Brachybacterium faecium]